MNTKLCASCGETKGIACFSSWKGMHDGLQPTCKACQSERWKRYKAEKADKIREQQRAYHAKPEVKARRSAKRTSPEGRASARAYHAEYRKKNRAKLLEYERRYNARKAANGGTFTDEDRETLLAVCGHKCLACGSTDRLVADHVIPVSRGGSNGIENRQVLCWSCNSKKNDGTTDFRKAL